MSGNKMGKITRKSLFEYVQFWRKGAANYSQKCRRNLNFSVRKHLYNSNIKDEQVLSQTNSESPKNNIRPNVYKRNSPTSIIVEQNAHCPKDAYFEKRYEFDLAALKLSKCNETLKDYFAKQRLKQSTKESSDAKKLPEMVAKLNDIMALNVATTETKIKPNRESLSKFHSGSKRNIVDFKPQSNVNLNRWYIKLPTRPQLKDLKITLPVDSGINRLDKPKKTNDLVEADGKTSKKSIPSVCSENSEEIEEDDEIDSEEMKPQENWQLGALSIPRLDI